MFIIATDPTTARTYAQTVTRVELNDDDSTTRIVTVHTGARYVVPVENLHTDSDPEPVLVGAIEF